jgi:hypothetical protein
MGYFFGSISGDFANPSRTHHQVTIGKIPPILSGQFRTNSTGTLYRATQAGSGATDVKYIHTAIDAAHTTRTNATNHPEAIAEKIFIFIFSFFLPQGAAIRFQSYSHAGNLSILFL